MKRIFDKLCIAITVFVVVTLSVAFFVIPDKTFSDKENRNLEKYPTMNLNEVLSGRYTESLGRYFADQFPLRDAFVSAKAYAELAGGRGENNGVIYTKEGILIPKDNMVEIRIKDNLASIKNFEINNSADVTLAALPRTIDVFSEHLPSFYPKQEDLAIWKQFDAIVSELDIDCAQLYGLLCESDAYYKTDHHYTSYGAYLVYKALGEKLGYSPKDEKFFKRESATKEFCGTAMRSSGFYLAPKDEIVLFRYDGDTEYTVTSDSEKIELYDFSKLDTTDKYAVFLSGNHARVDIADGSGKREKLLIIRDSFADSIAPFLALHFDLVLIDFRYYSDSVAELISSEGISKVLVLECITELATARNLSYLSMP